jgi:hypothetical protein
VFKRSASGTEAQRRVIPTLCGKDRTYLDILQSQYGIKHSGIAAEWIFCFEVPDFHPQDENKSH